MGEEKDLPPGRKLVECFTPFLLDLAASGLSKRTIQRHVDNLWILGGEIIREVNEEPSLRKVPAKQRLSAGFSTRSNNLTLWPHGNCATACCTIASSGQASAKALIYLRLREQSPCTSGNSERRLNPLAYSSPSRRRRASRSREP